MSTSDQTPDSLLIQNLTVSNNTSNAPTDSDSSSSGYVTPSTEPSQESGTLSSAQQSSQTSATATSQSSSNKPKAPQQEQNISDVAATTHRPDEAEGAPPAYGHFELPKGPFKTPFSHPLPTCKPAQRPPLTSDQHAKFNTFFKTVTSWTSIPTSTGKNAPSAPLNDNERMWLTRECLLRYLRAVSWTSADAAAKRLLATLIWRREFKVDQLTPEYISPENETGKQVILGYDIHARPCLYLNPGRQNTKQSDRQIEHLVYMLERVIDMMDAGQETTALLINYRGSSAGNSPSVKTGKAVLNILQGHYPERLGRACISDLPWLIHSFFKLIGPFIDPVTREKMIFNQDLRKHVPPEQLDRDFGGEAEFVYEHGVYWPVMNQMCEDRRERRRERWAKAGSRIGEFEAYLRGGEQKCLAEVEKDEGAKTTA